MKKHNFIRISYSCICLFFKLLPGTIICYIILNILYAFMWMFQTVALQLFFDMLESKQLWTGLGILGASYGIYHIIDGISNGYSEIVFMKMVQKLNDLLFQKTGTLKAVEFEDSRRLDEIEKAKNGAKRLPGICMTVLDILTCYLFYFVFIGWYLFSSEPYLALCIVAVFIPALISKLVHISKFHKLEEEEAPLRRMEQYYEECLTGRAFLKETRIFGASSFFTKRYESTLEKRTKLKLQMIRQQKLLEIILKGVSACGYGVIVGFLFHAVMQQKISLGVFSAVLATVGNMFRFMDKMVSERLGWATENIGLVGNFLDFIKEPLVQKKVSAPVKDAVVLQQVSFRYPNGERNVLENIDLTIRSGETIALVGENGSGKTTLARILMGLYEPTDGEVFYGKQRVSAVFQKFCKYQMRLRENLTISNELNGETEELNRICKECGIELTEEVGFDSMLGREFGGSDLSGGQWQRIAIGRGMFRKHDMIILDEPTAAIDPLEEARIYREFAEICKEKTAVLITHRMGAVKMADRILVMQKGRIVQDGTHMELMQKEGLYREMYEAQKQWYNIT